MSYLCTCGHNDTAHDGGECFYSYNCNCKSFEPSSDEQRFLRPAGPLITPSDSVTPLFPAIAKQKADSELARDALNLYPHPIAHEISRLHSHYDSLAQQVIDESGIYADKDSVIEALLHMTLHHRN